MLDKIVIKMPSITISLDEKVKKVLSSRASKNLLTLREQIEDILRKSAVRTKSLGNADLKNDDRLVGIFSRQGKKSRKR